MNKSIKTALISVFDKDNLLPILKKLDALGVEILTTGGTYDFIVKNGFTANKVEDLTDYPSILGGRVKTLHPKVFGGILGRGDLESDVKEMKEYAISPIDLVIVDLYPFEKTVTAGASHSDIIEKIDIGGISLIRAAAKNYKEVTVISSMEQYEALSTLLEEKEGNTTIEDRKSFASKAFDVSSHYDTEIYKYMSREEATSSLKVSIQNGKSLRYGENPHQKAAFFGDMDAIFDKLSGKELSFNNLVDIDAAVNLIQEFEGETAFAILKHTNPCGCAVADTVANAYKKAFAADTVSAFGGILATNGVVDLEAAEQMHGLFFEVLIAKGFSDEAKALLMKKSKRILMIQKINVDNSILKKTLLNGVILQDADHHTDSLEDLKDVAKRVTTDAEKEDLIFASKIAKHTKSNTIVFAKGKQLLASGVGQTSRVDALKQAITKGTSFGFEFKDAVMASDAFFPFPDCVELASEVGVIAVLQPGGSIRDQASIDTCNDHGMSMVMTGVRHFKH